jgi:uncharacterized NAD(P)/FAD-binding protein YdhS
VALEEPCAIRARAFDLLGASGMLASVVAQSASLDGVLSAVRAGLGLALLPIASDIPAGLRELSGLPPAGWIGVHLVSREGLADTVIHTAVTMLSSFLATTTGLARDGLAAGHSRGLAGIGAEFPARHMDERLVPAVLSHHAARLSIKPTDNICYSGVVWHSEPFGGRVAVVAVIGGGASGTLATTYLLRAAAVARIPLRIALIDRHGQHGLGQAYATAHPAHLLNSPADRMSAVAHDPGHLVRWAVANGIKQDGFLPRAAFGRYLRELLADAERMAGPTATVIRITSDVVGLTCNGLHRPLRLHLGADGRIDANAAVLATGSQPPAPPCPVPASPRYVRDPWTPGALDGVADGSPVVVLGTGLSMLDVAISLTGAHPETVLHAVSRHALLPREHRCPPYRAVQPPILQAPDRSPVDLPGLIRHVRVAAAEAPDGGQAVVDALRPYIPGLWQRLSPPEKRLFLRQVARYWEVHRHRVPPATARRIDQLRSAGRLSVLRGRVIAVNDKPTGLCVRIEQDARVIEVAAGWLINATGPAADVTATTDPLLRGLLDSGLARPDSLRLGIEADARGALLNVSGTASDVVFTLGPPLRGQLYETTAIPEIRDQAAALAGPLLAACHAHAAPLAAPGMAGSAA